MLLRLRQATIHPSLVTHGDHVKNALASAEDDKAHISSLQAALGEDVWETIVEHLVQEQADLANADDDEEAEVANECPICSDFGETPVITPCCHTFCQRCLFDWINAPQRDRAQEPTCPTCRSVLGGDKIVPIHLIEKSDGFEERVCRARGMDEDEIEKVLDEKRKEEEELLKARELELIKPELVTSTKFNHMWRKMEEWREEGEPKVIIISSFTSALDLCYEFLRQKDVRCKEFTGKMSLDERDDAVQCVAVSHAR